MVIWVCEWRNFTVIVNQMLCSDQLWNRLTSNQAVEKQPLGFSDSKRTETNKDIQSGCLSYLFIVMPHTHVNFRYFYVSFRDGSKNVSRNTIASVIWYELVIITSFYYLCIWTSTLHDSLCLSHWNKMQLRLWHSVLCMWVKWIEGINDITVKTHTNAMASKITGNSNTRAAVS